MDKSSNKNISSDEIMQFFNDNGLTEEMNKIKSDIIRRIDILGERITEHTGHPSIDHIVSRVKSPESIIRKLKKKKRDVTPQNAVSTLHDIVGIRAVCPFQDDADQRRGQGQRRRLDDQLHHRPNRVFIMVKSSLIFWTTIISTTTRAVIVVIRACSSLPER